MKYIVNIFIILFCINVFAINEYNFKSAKLSELNTRVNDIKSGIKDLITAKNNEKDDKVKQQLIKDIVEKHEELKKTVKRYNDLRLEIKYKFPHKGDTAERKYMPLKQQSIEDIENETGVSNILTRVKQKVDKKYRAYTQDDVTKEDIKKQAKKQQSKEEKPKRLKLEQ